MQNLFNSENKGDCVAEYRYIYMQQMAVSDTGKTALFGVMNKKSGEPLATIKWYPAWRQYCFFPFGNTVWNNSCLQDILDFIFKLKTGQIKPE